MVAAKHFITIGRQERREVRGDLDLCEVDTRNTCHLSILSWHHVSFQHFKVVVRDVIARADLFEFRSHLLHAHSLLSVDMPT